MCVIAFLHKGPGGAGFIPGGGTGGVIPGRVPFIPGYGCKHDPQAFDLRKMQEMLNFIKKISL